MIVAYFNALFLLVTEGTGEIHETHPVTMTGLLAETGTRNMSTFYSTVRNLRSPGSTTVRTAWVKPRHVSVRCARLLSNGYWTLKVHWLPSLLRIRDVFGSDFDYAD
jgi:hypothetical protein